MRQSKFRQEMAASGHGAIAHACASDADAPSADLRPAYRPATGPFAIADQNVTNDGLIGKKNRIKQRRFGALYPYRISSKAAVGKPHAATRFRDAAAGG